MYREHRGSVPESKRFDLMKIQLSSKLSPKDPKEFAKKIREWRGAAPGKGRPSHHNTKGNSAETSRLFAHTQRSVAGALRLKFSYTPLARKRTNYKVD